MSDTPRRIQICGYPAGPGVGGNDTIPISRCVHSVASRTDGINAMGWYSAAPPVLANGDGTRFLTDNLGRLDVVVAGGGAFATHDALHIAVGPQIMADYNAVPVAVHSTDAVRVQATAEGYLWSRARDATRAWLWAEQNIAQITIGPQMMGVYNQGADPILTGRNGRVQLDNRGHIEPADFSRAQGGSVTYEQIPVELDLGSGIVRASAALAAQGAYDTPIVIYTLNRRYALLMCSYTRVVALGAVLTRVEACITIANTDVWGYAAMVAPDALASAQDTQVQMQRTRPHRYDSTDAGAEIYYIVFDLGRVPKFRVSCAEIGVKASPGTMAVYYHLFN
jgi:hypothetical protein